MSIATLPASMILGERSAAALAGKSALFAASAAVALAVTTPALHAQVMPGIAQSDEQADAFNLLLLEDTGEPILLGRDVLVVDPLGAAYAQSIVSCADEASCATPGSILQWARGTNSASNELWIGADLTIAARAKAEGAEAGAAGYVTVAVEQIAAAEELAQNYLDLTGRLSIEATADATATGYAWGFAAIDAGIVQDASTIGTQGSAFNIFGTDGDLDIVARAHATSEADAETLAILGQGIVQSTIAQAQANASFYNFGDIFFGAEAQSIAAGAAHAEAVGTGLVQVADTHMLAFEEIVDGDGNLVGTTRYAAAGPTEAMILNAEGLAINVTARAQGGSEAEAEAEADVLGITQDAHGSSTMAFLSNNGSIGVFGNAFAEAEGYAKGVVFASGVSQVATAIDTEIVETISPDGTITLDIDTLPSGPATAWMINSQDLFVEGRVDVRSTGDMAEALGVAFVAGIDQQAGGSSALAQFKNSNILSVSADVAVAAEGVANGVALASGIDQYATAYAVHTALVFASGTTTPSSFDFANAPVGPAEATLDNSGYLAVSASVASLGGEMAFAGATASGLGQFAAGTEASVEIDNDGILLVAASLESEGRTAFGGVAAIGFQQGAQGSAHAEADFANDEIVAIRADGHGAGELGAFINATAFAGAQSVMADEVAEAQIANAGTLAVRATADAEASGASATAMGFASVHGLGQLASGNEASVAFVNEGTLDLLAEAEVLSSDFALASAQASGAIQQVAFGDTASATIDNQGVIAVSAHALADAGSTALAMAGIERALVQQVTGGAEAQAQIDNDGTIALIAEADAVADGEEASFASAQGYAFGLDAVAMASASDGTARAGMDNRGTIDIAGIGHAVADGKAAARGSAAFGMVANASSWGTGEAAAQLANSGELILAGIGIATGGHSASGMAVAVGGMNASASSAGDAIAEIANDGTLTLLADAEASAGTNALAVAISVDALQQRARAGSGQATTAIDNDGELAMIANAEADALNAQAYAIVGGTFFSGAVFQSAAATDGGASVIADNQGSLSVVASALAHGEVIASASAVGGPGINQFAFATGGEAFGAIHNSGSLEFVAQGAAHASNSAFADALFYNAVSQFANANGDRAALDLVNEGTISVTSLAEAEGGAVAGAFALATHEVGQVVLAIGGDADVVLDNQGSITLDVGALAEGSRADASALFASAIVQAASSIGEGEASVVLDNSGTIDLGVLASATSPDATAAAHANLVGAASQFAGAGTGEYGYGSTEGGMSSAWQHDYPTGPALVALDNSGTIDIAVASLAKGGEEALATADGLGIIQTARGLEATASFANAAEVGFLLGARADAALLAEAQGALTAFDQHADAIETTTHYVATAEGGQTTDVTYVPAGSAEVAFANSGAIVIAGQAEANAEDEAHAAMTVRGIVQSVDALEATARFDNQGDLLVKATASLDALTGSAEAAAIGLSIDQHHGLALDVGNSGDLVVTASATGGADGERHAEATGILAGGAGSLGGAIRNEGDIAIRALASGGSVNAASATGIMIEGATDGLLVANSGSLVVEALGDAGATHATAIIAAGAGDVSVVNDGGTIIARTSADNGAHWQRGTAIDLSTGGAGSSLVLKGDGGIFGNIALASGQQMLVTGGETWLAGSVNADCAGTGCGRGDLAIADGATLYLRGGSESTAHLEGFTMGSEATLALDLPAQGAGTASSIIVADTVALGGTLLLRSSLTLFDDRYVYDNLIDAEVRSGQFASCGMAGQRALLDIACSYDAQGNVDLTIDRVAFDAVAGLGLNQAAAGSGIEAIYDPAMTGAFRPLVEQLFTFDDARYTAALDQLSGASHGGFLQSLTGLAASQADRLADGFDCRGDADASACASRFGLWGQVSVGESRQDAEGATGYDVERLAATLGGRLRLDGGWAIGASLSKIDQESRFEDASEWDGDGVQLGLHGAYDRGKLEARASASYGWFEGESRRRVDFASLGGSLDDVVLGDAKARLSSLSARIGYRLDLGTNATLRPQVALDHVAVDLDGFKEQGSVAALRIDEASASRTSVTAGARFDTVLGELRPRLDLAYRHQLGDRRAEVEAAFAAVPGSDFSIVSPLLSRSALLAGVAVDASLGPVDLSLGYDGRFDGSSSDHAGTLRLVLPLGGR